MANTRLPRALRERKDALDDTTKEDRRNHATRILNFESTNVSVIKQIANKLERVKQI